MVISFPVVPLESWNLCGEPAAGTGMCAFHVDLPPTCPTTNTVELPEDRAPLPLCYTKIQPSSHPAQMPLPEQRSSTHGHERFIDINAHLIA